MQREGAMPFVSFEVRAVEDRAASMKMGRYMTKDVDYILIVPIGSGGKERIEQVYADWLEQRKVETGRNEIRTGDSMTPMFAARFPDEWLTKIEVAYGAWKKGQEMPVDGTPVKQWAVLSPAQQQHLAGLGIQTVEQLAETPDGTIEMIGIGGYTLRQRARDYLKLNSNEANKTTAELEQLRMENESLKKRVEKFERFMDQQKSQAA